MRNPLSLTPFFRVDLDTISLRGPLPRCEPPAGGPSLDAIARQLAALFVELGKLGEAETVYANALRPAPGQPDALCGLGQTAERRGELARTKTLYGETVPRHAPCGWANRFFGRRQLAQGDVGAAILQFERLVELRPRDPDAHNDLGVAYIQHGWVPAAREQWRAALAIALDHVEAKRNLARPLAEKPGAAKATPTP